MICEFCERDDCDTDCYFASRNGAKRYRNTAAEWREVGAEMVAAWLDSIAEGPSLCAAHARALAAEVREGKWRALTHPGDR
jgi:hypothetical protein